jgi:probable rRNA maturation factor
MRRTRRTRTPPPAPLVLVRVDHPQGAAAGRTLRRAGLRFLRELGLSGGELSIVVATDAQIRRVNRAWRDRDEATDVLSFPADAPALPDGTRCLGDVVISLDTARRRARADRGRVGDELALYLAHGLLHLLGHDHHRPLEARRMARAERRLLGAAGMVQGSVARRPAATSPGRAPPPGRGR